MTEAETTTADEETEIEKYEPPKTEKEVWEQIDTECSFDLTPLPRKLEAMWHPRRAAFEAMFLFSSMNGEGKPMLSDDERLAIVKHDIKRMLLKVGEPLGLAPVYSVFALFETDQEIIAYAVSFEEGKHPPSRFHLSKTAPVPIYSRDVMGWEVFVAEMANEMSVLDAKMTHAAREKLAILDYAERMPADYSLRDFISDIEDEKHYEVVEEEEEDDDDPVSTPNGATASEPAAAGVAS